MKEDYTEKADTLNEYLKRKSLAANGDAVAQFRLAQSYPKNSTHYLKWMESAAEHGLANANLALSKAFAEKGSLTQAAHCLVKIFNADNDSYMKSEANKFLIENPALNQAFLAMQRHGNPAKTVIEMEMTKGLANVPCRFFSYEPATAEKTKALQQAPELR